MYKHSAYTRSKVSLAIALGLLTSQVVIADEDNNPKGLEVIEVTAQKRSENIQTVPIAISAFGENDIKKMGLANINDLGLLTPGLETNNATATQTSFNIRGITTNDFGIGLDAAVAVYIDGVYVGRRGTSNMNFNDVERVEVLKGPQGTLFGRNSAAGAIHIITKQATADNAGAIKFTLGNYEKRKVEFSTNLIVNPDMNFRGSFNSNHRGGYLDEKNSKNRYGNQRDWSARGALHWEINSDVEAIFRADYTDTNQQGRPAVTLNTSYGNGDPFAPIEYDAEGKETREAGGVSAEVNYQLSEEMALTSITAYRQFERTNYMEDDGSAYARAFFASNLIEDQDQFSQEFRLTQNGQNFKWTLGATFFHENITQQTHADFNTATFDALALVQSGADPRGITSLPFGMGVAGIYAAQYIPQQTIGAIMATNSMSFEDVMNAIVRVNVFNPHKEQFDNEGTTNSAALYFDGTYAVTDKLDVTLGARYTYDDKEFYLKTAPTNEIIMPFDGVDNIPLAVAFIPDEATQENSWEKFTPRLVVDYQWSSDIMTYASYSEGFKSGGFNTLGEAPPVKEETVKNTEVGLKSAWLDNQVRLNLSAYQYDYTNLQQLELFGAPIPTYNLRNVDAEGTGYDIELIWQVTEDFILTSNYGFTETEYTKWQFFDAEIASNTGNSKVGEPISGMPEDQGNVRMDYYFEGLSGQMNFHLSYAYTGDRTQSIDGPALAILPFEQGSVTGLNDDELNSISSYGLTNMRFSWQSDNHPINLAFFVNNLTDEQYLIQTGGQAMAVGSPIATPGLPRMFGFEFGMEF